jgi:colanic acid/amylovoran biosynthesis protein
MRIFVTGQCTVHWGRLEFGNIGNYYITETTFRELHRVFPNAEIVTTFQMTEVFCKRENVTSLPMDIFYNWSEDDLDNAMKEYASALLYSKTKQLSIKTDYIAEVMKSDLVIDFSGELWGDHADPVGENRFFVGLLKDRVAQLLGKKTVLLAGSQGPFSDKRTLEFAKEVFENFDLVANREGASIELLREYGFDVTKVQSFTDAAFLFEGEEEDKMLTIYQKEHILNDGKPVVGYILCGFNMLEGPYDKWPRRDDEFEVFAESVEYIVNNLGARVVFLSHQNGFILPPNFKLINGRDYPYAKGLYDILIKRGNVKTNDIYCIDKPYLPRQIKSIIGKFDMLVTGRIHGFVAGVSQSVPTVIINRGNSPKSLRNLGFAMSVGMDKYLASPSDKEELLLLIEECFTKREELRKTLNRKLPKVFITAHKLYDSLLSLF